MCVLIILLLFMFLISVNEPFELPYKDGQLINRHDYKSLVNPSPIIAPDVLQTGYTGCDPIDFRTAEPEDISRYYTCLNAMKRVAIKRLTGFVGSSHHIDTKE
jgi:hypothetical protein